MKMPFLFVALVLAAPPIAVAGPAADAVKFFYTPVKFEPDAKYRDRFTEPVTKLFALNDEALRKNPDQMPCIDFDPGLDAQDFDQKTVSRTLKLDETISGDTAEVTARFDLFPEGEGEGSRREMIWSLKQVGGSWKVADLTSKTNGWTLSTLECMTGESLD
ncbi:MULTISPECIES: hypothetical protein [unclassified Mesorhizobium]|uniref:hypothetical protein n=1 Tax=unclassified Mesorhizobium TaxID=325217 RepID=UPI0006FC13A3|nr:MULTISPECIES: hypothetical protein [unclassified Mesorhizobium]KQZ15846.1 hypothetical protein ASD27_06305 [Mesorhizobium sp. Root1471]KQZ38357.1 hypothetical protein ASD44_06300 [Mesorhizobium sp. Root554]MDR7032680.1 hypothetical protein [Mesorhizobium sp. BE184]